MKKKNVISTAILTIIGIVLSVLFLSPILILLSNSFKSLKNIYLNVLAFPNADTFTLKNYPEAFVKLDFVRSLLNSLGITVASTILLLLFCSMAA